MRVRTETRTLRELPTGGWLNKHTGRRHKTAVHALRAVRRAAKRDESGEVAVLVTVIEWETTTPVGRDVVRAIT